MFVRSFVWLAFSLEMMNIFCLFTFTQARCWPRFLCLRVCSSHTHTLSVSFSVWLFCNFFPLLCVLIKFIACRDGIRKYYFMHQQQKQRRRRRHQLIAGSFWENGANRKRGQREEDEEKKTEMYPLDSCISDGMNPIRSFLMEKED